MYTAMGTDFDETAGAGHHLLHRSKRDLQWSDIEEFYQDKNNFAMYLVLPIIVIVYGGCAVIYCIARCRRYMRRKRKKKLRGHHDITENEPLDGGQAEPTPIPSIPVAAAREGAATSSEVRVSMNNERETPLPWQVPGDYQAVGGAVAAANTGYSNKGYEEDLPQKNRDPSPRPPPSYDETYKPIRPMSKPPPYEEKGIRERRGSVEEIITLDAKPKDQPDRRDRKRPRPGSRSASRISGESRLEALDEDRMKARQLVRGERPSKGQPDKYPSDRPTDRYDRQKTPDIISHARTQPLQPRYKPPQQDPRADATLVARQAAQLLRLDQMGKQAGKKQKRLVFVAE